MAVTGEAELVAASTARRLGGGTIGAGAHGDPHRAVALGVRRCRGETEFRIDRHAAAGERRGEPRIPENGGR